MVHNIEILVQSGSVYLGRLKSTKYCSQRKYNATATPLNLPDNIFEKRL